MTQERAVQINDALMAHVWFREGLRTDLPPSLAEFSLREMLDASEMVAGVRMHCDPRLVAALYVAVHYPASPGAGLEEFEVIAWANNTAVVTVAAPARLGGWS